MRFAVMIRYGKLYVKEEAKRRRAIDLRATWLNARDELQQTATRL